MMSSKSQVLLVQGQGLWRYLRDTACVASVLFVAGGLPGRAIATEMPDPVSLPLVVAQNPTASGNPTAATLESGTYSNHFFDFSLQFPQDWAIATDQMTQQLQDVGTDLLAGDNEALRTAAETSLQNTYTLLMVSQFPLESAAASNPNLVVMAERIPPEAGIVREDEYLAVVGQLLQLSPIPYTVTQAPYPVDLGGRTFYRLDTAINSPYGSIEQSYITVLDGGYALSLILTGDANTMADLEAIATSLQF